MTHLAVRQIAYFVADIRAAAHRHTALFGSGPFFVADHIALGTCRYRGRQAALDHSSAYGQWGGVMIEFVQQNDAGPSVFRDLYPEGSGREGLHHVAIFVDAVAPAIARFAAAGFAEAMYAETVQGGLAFAMVDATATYGHMIELYAPTPGLVDFYAMVADAAHGFDGDDPLRPIAL